MPFIVLPQRGPFKQNPIPSRRVVRDFVHFWRGALTTGGKKFWWFLASVSAVAGGSLIAYTRFAAHFELAWALVIGLSALFLVLTMSAYWEWERAQDIAIAFAPTWQMCQARVDNLKVFLRNEQFSAGDGDNRLPLDQFSDKAIARFQAVYTASWEEATLRDYDRAATAGYPLSVERDEFRNPKPADLPRLIAAFEEAVREWQEREV
jgi:hypothetical protein